MHRLWFDVIKQTVYDCLKEVIIGMNTEKDDKKWQEDTALERFQIIAPLLDQDLDRDKRIQMREDIAQKYDLSVRTLYRYEAAYESAGFSGLKPKDRTREGRKDLPENFNQLLEKAIQLKREVPSRSVNQIILILELEGSAKPGDLKRSTLQHHLYDAGFGKKQMKVYADAEKSSGRRFMKTHRMQLAQADIKYVMKLPIGPNGGYVQCYICSIIDDHSKLILGTGVYATQDLEIVEDVYQRAILSFGVFDATYVDNGTQFVSKNLVDALSRLGIRHLRAKPYKGNSKGKIEVYNRLINSYIAECHAAKIKTLEDARHKWDLFVEEYYHDKEHTGIREYYESKGVYVPPEGITPRQEFNRDSRQLKFLDAKLVGQAFLHHEERRVDQGACISFRGRKFAVPPALIGAKVKISYDPLARDTVYVDFKGMDTFEAHPIVIGEFVTGTRPKLPPHMQKVTPESSRFFDALEKKRNERSEPAADAISFGDYVKEGHDDV